MVAVLAHKLLALIGCREQNFGIMCAHKLPSLLRRFAHDDALWLLEHDAQQGTDARGTSPYDEYSILGSDVAYACCPESCSQHIAHQQSLFVAYSIWYAAQSLRGQRHTHVLGLPAIYPASQSPAAVRRCAVVHIAVPAEETFAAEGFHVDRHTVSHLHATYLWSCFLHYAHHLVAHCDARYSPGYAAVLDVQVARADAAQCDPHDGVGRLQERWTRFLNQGKVPLLYICICFHPCWFVLSIRLHLHCLCA